MSDDPLDELGQELRQKVAGEFRRTAEEDEFAARKIHLRSRDLGAIAHEVLSRGDQVEVIAEGLRMRGSVVHAKGTVATIEGPAGTRLDVNLAAPLIIHVVDHSTAGGRSRDPFGSDSFLARLRELEIDEARVRIIANGEVVIGRLEAVGTDHVMVIGNDQLPWYISLHAIVAVEQREGW